MQKLIVISAVAVAIATTALSGYLVTQLKPSWWSDQKALSSASRTAKEPPSEMTQDMRQRQIAASRLQNSAQNVFLTGRESGGEWTSKADNRVRCGATVDGRYFVTNGRTIRSTLDSTVAASASFERDWNAYQCHDSAPMNDPNAPVWHPFPDDVDAADLAKATRQIMQDALNDYESARFRNAVIHYVRQGSEKRFAMCGEVNARNGFGGYAGWAVFGVGLVNGEYRVFFANNVQDFPMFSDLCMSDQRNWIVKNKLYSREISAR